jgi:hypothetical protein
VPGVEVKNSVSYGRWFHSKGAAVRSAKYKTEYFFEVSFVGIFQDKFPPILDNPPGFLEKSQGILQMMNYSNGEGVLKAGIGEGDTVDVGRHQGHFLDILAQEFFLGPL